MDKMAEEVVAYCVASDISDPCEILRVVQDKFVKGRDLEIQNVDEGLEGSTQYISVDRGRVLQTAFEEIKGVALADLRKTLQVVFYGEVCNAKF